MDKKSYASLKGIEDQYDQISKIAIGGMAEIYRGRQKNLDRSVAIKKIKTDLKDNADIKKRFKREAIASANLLHQNLAHVYDYRVIGEESYIIMEYIDGIDLSELIHKAPPFPEDVALLIASQVLAGLAHIHSHGMVHRDIKPDNIRLSLRGEVKIMDFGIALDPSENNLTMPGVLIGSPHYVSPEQILGSRVDARADIFAFGITFYEMLTGKRPFSETGSETVFERIKRGEYAKIEAMRSDLNPYVIRIIEDCLSVNLERRPSSSKSLGESLQGFISQNHTALTNSRIKQFLIENKFLKGNAAMIEIDEKTFERKITTKATPANISNFLAILLLVITISSIVIAFMSRPV